MKRQPLRRGSKADVAAKNPATGGGAPAPTAVRASAETDLGNIPVIAFNHSAGGAKAGEPDMLQFGDLTVESHPPPAQVAPSNGNHDPFGFDSAKSDPFGAPPAFNSPPVPAASSGPRFGSPAPPGTSLGAS